MNEKLQITKDSIDLIFASETFKQYMLLKDEIEQNNQVKMYKYILDNKDKFSISVIDNAKLKYVYKHRFIRDYQRELDSAFNNALKLYEESRR